jgi:hypothetical protein
MTDEYASRVVDYTVHRMTNQIIHNNDTEDWNVDKSKNVNLVS